MLFYCKQLILRRPLPEVLNINTVDCLCPHIPAQRSKQQKEVAHLFLKFLQRNPKKQHEQDTQAVMEKRFLSWAKEHSNTLH